MPVHSDRVDDESARMARQSRGVPDEELKESGGRLVSLSFPETRAQRIGDTVIFYGSFDVLHLDSREMPN